MRRPVAAAVTGDAELGGGVDDGAGGGVGDARVERDLEGVVVRGRVVPRRRLQQRVGEEAGEPFALLVVEIALDEGRCR